MASPAISLRSLFEDREGDVWVATLGGLDRFRNYAVATYAQHEGLGTVPGWGSVAAGSDGSIWMGTKDGLRMWSRGSRDSGSCRCPPPGGRRRGGGRRGRRGARGHQPIPRPCLVECGRRLLSDVDLDGDPAVADLADPGRRHAGRCRVLQRGQPGPGLAGGSGSSGTGSGSGAGGGTYTSLPAVGQVVRQGQVLYSVSGSPVVLLYGTTPAYRDLAEGDTGPDVTELNTDLVTLGYLSAADLGARPGWDYYSGATAYGVELLQAELGGTETGSLDLGQAVFLPGAIEVTAYGTNVVLGGAATAGTVVLTASSTTPVVTIDLDASLQTEVHAGEPVSITLPSGVHAKLTRNARGGLMSAAEDGPGEIIIRGDEANDPEAAAGAPTAARPGHPGGRSGRDRRPRGGVRRHEHGGSGHVPGRDVCPVAGLRQVHALPRRAAVSRPGWAGELQQRPDPAGRPERSPAAQRRLRVPVAAPERGQRAERDAAAGHAAAEPQEHGEGRAVHARARDRELPRPRGINARIRHQLAAGDFGRTGRPLQPQHGPGRMKGDRR